MSTKRVKVKFPVEKPLTYHVVRFNSLGNSEVLSKRPSSLKKGLIRCKKLCYEWADRNNVPKSEVKFYYNGCYYANKSGDPVIQFVLQESNTIESDVEENVK